MESFSSVTPESRCISCSSSDTEELEEESIVVDLFSPRSIEPIGDYYISFLSSEFIRRVAEKTLENFRRAINSIKVCDALRKKIADCYICYQVKNQEVYNLLLQKVTGVFERLVKEDKRLYQYYCFLQSSKFFSKIYLTSVKEAVDQEMGDFIADEAKLPIGFDASSLDLIIDETKGYLSVTPSKKACCIIS